MGVVDIKSLPFSSKAGLCWSFFWRGLVITMGSSLAGGLLGFVIGLVFTLAGLPVELIQIVAGLAGLVAGCFFLYLYVKWLLSSQLGPYRLQLVHNDR